MEKELDVQVDFEKGFTIKCELFKFRLNTDASPCIHRNDIRCAEINFKTTTTTPMTTEPVATATAAVATNRIKKVSC